MKGYFGALRVSPNETNPGQGCWSAHLPLDLIDGLGIEAHHAPRQPLQQAVLLWGRGPD